MFKKSWTSSNVQSGLCCIKILLIVLLAVNQAESSICEENKPCQGHGGCFVINDETSQLSFLSTKCVCSRGYSGRWCQFPDLPGSPKILTQLSSISHQSTYNLTWEQPSETRTTPPLYYAVRYRIVGESNWKNVDEILASNAQTTYSYVFQSLYWDVNYEVEIYAASSQGVGKPARGIIRRPKVGYPEITYVSKDKIGDDTILANSQFHLRCEARGEPRPSLSWFLNGELLSGEGNISFANGNLTVLRASIEDHEGVYRCVATNQWGSVMSPRVKVTVAAPVKFKPHYEHKTVYIVIGKPTFFQCPAHTPISPGISYKWGNRDGNSSNDFEIEPSQRVWVTTHGWLVFQTFEQQDADLFNEKGIRCIIEQRISSRRFTIMSKVFTLDVIKSSFSWPSKPVFLERPKSVTLLRGETLELHCSAFGFQRGNVFIEWVIDAHAGNTKRFPNGVKTRDFGRVLKYYNVQISDSGKIVCKAFQYQRQRITTSYAFLKVLYRPEDLYENRPRKISVYSSSTLLLGPFHTHVPISWYYNAKRLNNKKSYLQFGGDHFASTKGHSGVYQIDFSYKMISFTAPTYVQFIDDETLDETIPARSGVQLYCVPPATFSLPDIEVVFSQACRSKVADNSITIAEETAWKHDLCDCKASGDFYLVSRKFDIMDGAMFSSHGTWVWSQWSTWSHCPQSQDMCGQNISTSRHRTCYNPTPNLDGEYCSGSTKQKQPCPFIPCQKKIPSFWTKWSIWSDCSSLCGPGTQSRRRRCIAPSEGPCPEGEWHESKMCAGAVCYNVEGNWGKWSKWSKCSKSCGTGSRMRQRHCSESAKQQCIGRSREHVRCSRICKPPKEKDEESDTNEIYSKGIFFIPNTVALFTAVFLIGLGISMAVHKCCKKSRKNSKHRRLLQDLFHKPDLDIERQPLLETETKSHPTKKRPPTREHRLKHKAAKYNARSKAPVDRNDTSASLAPLTPPGNLPPPSPSMLAPTGGIASPPPVGGSVPPAPSGRGVAPAASAPSSAGAPPPPPPPPGPKR